MNQTETLSAKHTSDEYEWVLLKEADVLQLSDEFYNAIWHPILPEDVGDTFREQDDYPVRRRVLKSDLQKKVEALEEQVASNKLQIYGNAALWRNNRRLEEEAKEGGCKIEELETKIDDLKGKVEWVKSGAGSEVPYTLEQRHLIYTRFCEGEQRWIPCRPKDCSYYAEILINKYPDKDPAPVDEFQKWFEDAWRPSEYASEHSSARKIAEKAWNAARERKGER